MNLKKRIDIFVYDIFDFSLDEYGDETGKLILKIKTISTNCEDKRTVRVSFSHKPFEIQRDEKSGLWLIYENIIQRDEITGLWPKVRILYEFLDEVVGSPVTLYITIKNSKKTFDLMYLCDGMDEDFYGWMFDAFDLPLDKYGDETGKLFLKIKTATSKCDDETIYALNNMSI